VLEHFVFGNKNEALTGDLLEEYQRRRSNSWYWRQVFGAILAGLASELRAEWCAAGPATVWAFGLTTVWVCFVPEYWPPFPWIIERMLVAIAIRQPWGTVVMHVMGPYIQTGLSIADNAVMLGLGIALYLALLRSLNLRCLARGLAVGLLLVTLEDQTWQRILHLRGLLLWHYISFLWLWFSWLPLFVAVLISLWTAGWPRKRSDGERVFHGHASLGE
jgi:hypothetical protein